MQRAKREGFVFGAKLVRGAYMYMERERAEERGYPSPVHDTLEDTHGSYERCAAPGLGFKVYTLIRKAVHDTVQDPHVP